MGGAHGGDVGIEAWDDRPLPPRPHELDVSPHSQSLAAGGESPFTPQQWGGHDTRQFVRPLALVAASYWLEKVRLSLSGSPPALLALWGSRGHGPPLRGCPLLPPGPGWVLAWPLGRPMPGMGQGPDGNNGNSPLPLQPWVGAPLSSAPRHNRVGAGIQEGLTPTACTPRPRLRFPTPPAKL